MTSTLIIKDAGQISLDPGQKQRYWLEVGHSWFGPERLPLIVLRGIEAGPKLVTLACQHGDEGYGVLGALDLANELDPAAMKGELWILPCANIHGFTAGKRASPYDCQDMNRVHPGKADGTVSEQIAYALHQQVFPGADLIVDLHGGSPENGDTAFAMWADIAGKPSILPIVSSLKLDFVIGSRKSIAGMLSNSAIDLGIPQISIEAGSAINYGRDNAALMQGFVRDCMKHLNMLPEPPPQSRSLPLMRMATHYAETGGAFKTLVAFGEEVRQGQTLGYIMDLVGNIAQEVRASEAGIVAVMRTGIRVHPGETVTTLAIPTGASS